MKRIENSETRRSIRNRFHGLHFDSSGFSFPRRFFEPAGRGDRLSSQRRRLLAAGPAGGDVLMLHSMSVWFSAVAAAAVLAAPSSAAEFYVAPGGSDANPGDKERPFASVQRAQEAAQPGDTVFLRGGTYRMTEAHISKKKDIWAYMTFLDKSGAPGKPIRYWAFPGERPVFDFSQVKPGLRVMGFYVTASWIHLKGIEATGLITSAVKMQSTGFDNQGDHNVYEACSVHDSQAIGFWIGRGKDNLILNCDAYRNAASNPGDERGGNVDGFGFHGGKSATGNVYRGCRAWFNSDDGFDAINSGASVTWEDCWAFYNGYGPNFESLADGNGFKAGGYGGTPAERVPNPVPRHVVRRCLAVRNKASGFYANHHIGGLDWLNNTGFRNGTDFNMLCRKPDNVTDVPGYGHVLKNNLSFRAAGGRGTSLSRIDFDACTLAANSFDPASPIPVSGGDFLGLDEADLVKPRRPDGALPDVPFLHLAPGSALIDRGVEVGFPFQGKAPDLGCFEAPAAESAKPKEE